MSGRSERTGGGVSLRPCPACSTAATAPVDLATHGTLPQMSVDGVALGSWKIVNLMNNIFHTPHSRNCLE